MTSDYCTQAETYASKEAQVNAVEDANVDDSSTITLGDTWSEGGSAHFGSYLMCGLCPGTSDLSFASAVTFGICRACH